MYQTIKTALSKVAPTYDPGVKIGEVKTPYLVLHNMGVDPNPRTGGRLGQHVYEVVALVPLGRQRELKPLCDRARAALMHIPRLKFTGENAPTDIEEAYRGTSRSLIYRLPVII